jgi:hypothetical protein
MKNLPMLRRAFVLGGVGVALGAAAAAQEPRAPQRSDGGDAAGWDRVFGREKPPYNTEGNAFLAAALERMQREALLPAGASAIDLATGDGRNALLLAEKGLAVTGLDISTVGLEKARAKAKERGLPFEALEQDLFTYDYGSERWDLVSLIYFNPALAILDRLKTAVKAGGLIAIEGQGSEHKGDGPPPATRFKPNQLLQAFADWRVLAYEDGKFACDWFPAAPTHVVRILARKPGPEPK